MIEFLEGWEAEQERDLQMMAADAAKALAASKTRPLTEDEIMAIAFSAGIANETYKELRHEQK